MLWYLAIVKQFLCLNISNQCSICTDAVFYTFDILHLILNTSKTSS